MTRMPDTDVAIIGAGLAGLSIATWLAESGDGATLPRVTLIEPRLEDANDHTWCFWDQQPHPFREAICHRWPRWRLHHKGQVVEREDQEACYAMISEDALSTTASRKLQDVNEFDVKRGTYVRSISPGRDFLDVNTTLGTLEARLVIDTRPPSLSSLSRQQGMWQVFHGLELEVPGHGFDVTTATLMDFQPSTDSIDFIYLLPLSSTRLLVEWTCFHVDRGAPTCRDLLTPEGLPNRLAHWLHQRLTGWTVIRHETGCLPMMPVRPPTLDSRYLAAGVRGGWMRPSTGYSFETCQRGARAVSGQLLQAAATGRWQLSAPRLRGPVLHWMDKVFLHALRRQPERAPEWFMQMFASTQAAQQRRFLGDTPGWLDMLAMMRALPSAPFLKAALAMAILPTGR
ncbi:lycopene cyclase family protein [Halomonas tibetensis]|uniref:Lycopene cyclase family protein n=1 Tax=Halomonas tibetensis TaxID=2259590 RepID=A0ABV7B8A1_9GAMM